MLLKQLRVMALLCCLNPLVALGCSEDDSEDDNTADDGNASIDGGTSSTEIEISAGDETESVSLTDVSTDEIDDTEVVRIDTLLRAADLDVDLSNVMLDFEGSDGYRPSTKDNCKEFLPTPGENADRVGINLDENNILVWDPDLNMSKCAAVKDVAIIHIEDK